MPSAASESHALRTLRMTPAVSEATLRRTLPKHIPIPDALCMRDGGTHSVEVKRVVWPRSSAVRRAVRGGLRKLTPFLCALSLVHWHHVVIVIPEEFEVGGVGRSAHREIARTLLHDRDIGGHEGVFLHPLGVWVDVTVVTATADMFEDLPRNGTFR